MLAHRVAVEVLDDEAALVELRPDHVRDRRLARPREAGEPQGEAARPHPIGLGVLVRMDVVAHWLLFGVYAALELVGAGPAACALLLFRSRRTGAGDAPDRPVAGLVQRVVGNLVHLDVGPDALLVPVGERVQLPHAIALGPLDLRGFRAAR